MPEPLNFVTEQEPWNIYRLEDGTIIRCKMVMARVTLREGQRGPEGEPLYDLKFQHIIDVTPSEIAMASAASRPPREST